MHIIIYIVLQAKSQYGISNKIMESPSAKMMAVTKGINFLAAIIYDKVKYYYLTFRLIGIY